MKKLLAVLLLSIVAVAVTHIPGLAWESRLYISEGDGIGVALPETLDYAGTIHTGKRGSIPAKTPDGKAVYVPCEKDDTVLVVDTVSDRVIKEIKVGKGPYQACATSDGRYVLISCSKDKKLDVINVASNEVEYSINLEFEPWYTVISYDGKNAIVGTGEDGRLLKIRLVDGSVEDNSDIPSGVYCMAISSDGVLYACSSSAQKILVYDTKNMKQIDSIDAYGIEGLALNSSEDELWMGGPEDRLTVYSLKTKMTLRELPRGNTGTFFQIIFSGDGKKVFAGPCGDEGKEIYIYDPVKLEKTGEISVKSTSRGYVYIDKTR